jgi:hypothetical protein
MSQYLSFELINKANPEIKVDLGYWCTSIARGITWNFENIFCYTEDNVKLDIDTLKDYIETLHSGIEEYKSNLRKEQENKRENVELLLRAQSQVTVDSIKEDIRNNDEAIAEWTDDIETWEMVETNLNFILDVLDKNNNEWELVYTNC